MKCFVHFLHKVQTSVVAVLLFFSADHERLSIEQGRLNKTREWERGRARMNKGEHT